MPRSKLSSATLRLRYVAMLATAVTGLALAPAAADAAGATPASPGPHALAAPAQFSQTASTAALAVPAQAGAPAYTLRIDLQRFQITTLRGNTVVMQTTAAGSGTGPARFTAGMTQGTATAVQDSSWQNGVLTLTLATDVPGDTVVYRITPQADRYLVNWSVQGDTPATKVGTDYVVAASGHWYGQGEAQTPDGGPYTRQPWPLDSGTVHDPSMGPAEYLMTDPFWFTQRGSGLWVDTDNVMDVSMNSTTQGVFGYTVTDSASASSTVFVERTPRAVYRDYIGITGTPQKSDATAQQYAEPLWNTWGQFYSSVTEAKVLAYAKALHAAGVPGHTIQVDDGWMKHYGEFAFNDKFPTPKKLSNQIHAMGYQFGLWVTLWINKDAADYPYAASHGYLVRSKADPSKPCDVQWWNGTAGIVDLANPAARNWYESQLRGVEKKYGVDGWKFDTRFFDESCAPYPGHTALDYIKLGAQLTDQFDQQGAGVRISWTGSQKYGFVTREVDKGTSWDSLQAAAAQDLAISTIGYPFVETDMIGGSLSQPPPTKQVLVRWAQAASLMPLMYSSASPLGVDSPTGTQTYDRQTVNLYRRAAQLHKLLAPYIEQQVRRAVATGEPIMKPIFFDFPGDQASYTLDNEWLLGDALLAAPVLTDGTSRDVNLPRGRWYDVLRHRVIQGPTELTGYHAGLRQTPMFIRLGTRATGQLRAALRRS